LEPPKAGSTLAAAPLWSPDMDRILAGAGAVRDVASMIA
jgi:hypothetical protein